MDDAITRYTKLFRGRGDARGSWTGGAIREPLTPDHFARHLDSPSQNDWIGVYPHLGPLGGQHCTWGCIDIDGKDFPIHYTDVDDAPAVNWNWDRMWDLARKLQAVLAVKHVYAHLERTKNGIHVWVFPEEGHCLARHMRRCLMAACKVLLYAPKEINPKQEELQPGKLGNYVRLPYFGWLAEGYVPLGDGERMFRDSDDNILSLEAFLDEVKLTKSEAIAEVAELWVPPPTVSFDGPPPKDVEDILGVLSGKAFTIWRDGPLEGRDRSNTLAKLAYTLHDDGITMPSAFAVIKDADRRWGKFADRPDCDEQIMKFVEKAYS